MSIHWSNVSCKLIIIIWNDRRQKLVIVLYKLHQCIGTMHVIMAGTRAVLESFHQSISTDERSPLTVLSITFCIPRVTVLSYTKIYKWLHRNQSIGKMLEQKRNRAKKNYSENVTGKKATILKKRRLFPIDGLCKHDIIPWNSCVSNIIYFHTSTSFAYWNA